MTNRPQEQKPSPEIVTTSENDPAVASLAGYAQMFAHLLSSGQTLCGQSHDVAARLCREVALITQQRAQLRLHVQTSSGTPPAASGYPVQFRERNYGTLYIVSDPAKPGSPALPLPLALLLAQVCGWLLFTFELAACLPGSNARANMTLTRREKEVLALMCQGSSLETIAAALSIAHATASKHRQHIYESFGVRNQRDASLAAFQAGLFSPLDDLPHQQ